MGGGVPVRVKYFYRDKSRRFMLVIEWAWGGGHGSRAAKL